jgi:hypothetical protein
MNYIQEIESKLFEKLPECPHNLVRLYALLVLTTGENTSWGNVHDAWAIWANHLTPQHKSLVEFELLHPSVKELDAKYAVAIREVALDINSRKR